MTVRSLGYRTDLFSPRFDGEVTDRGDHLAIRTPTNPTFHWGNFLLFDRPPAPGDLPRWRALFAQEVGTPPAVRHLAFGWNEAEDGDPGDIGPFLDAGFRLDDAVVLAARAVHRPAKYCDEAEIRPLATDAEWAASVEAQVAGRDPDYDEAGYREFAARQAERRRRMVEAGWGQWFGAFLEGRLAGDLGVFVVDGLGRYQSVGTHPDFRRRGVCGALVHQAGRYALERMGAERLVMVADAHYHAARIYESVGFAPVERQRGLTWWRREEAAA